MASRGRVDVIVVGSGASGAVIALRMARAGFSVVCLEQGAWPRTSDFRGRHLDSELAAAGPFNPNPNVRAAPYDYPIDDSQSDVAPLMFNGVGGSTVLYGAQWYPLLPSDFRVWSTDGVASDWPISYDDLASYYEENQVAFGVAGLSGNPAFPPGPPPPYPALPIGRIGELAAKGLQSLGWHWWPATNAILPKAVGRRGGCIQLGACVSGCPVGAKASTDLTHWPAAVRAGVDLRTSATASEITCDRNGRATGVAYMDDEHRLHHQQARIIVLAANGIGTPRLMLLSSGRRAANGIANSSGLVGRGLMIHPHRSLLATFNEDLGSSQGPMGASVVSLQFCQSDPSRGFRRGFKLTCTPTGGPYGLWALHRALNPSEPPYQFVRRRLNHSLRFAVMAEDLPNDDNRVELHSTLADAHGIQAPSVMYQTSDESRRILDFGLNRASEAARAAGAVAIDVLPPDRNTGWHLLGTARMGNNPETSVVDSWCCTHDVRNLYVVDGSVFVTASSLNPTATIAAIALRAADGIIRHRRDQSAPE
jgi:choline dehydrogenase-like flavoprotein